MRRSPQRSQPDAAVSAIAPGGSSSMAGTCRCRWSCFRRGLISAAKQATDPVEKPHAAGSGLDKRGGQRAAQLVPVADLSTGKGLAVHKSPYEMGTMLLPRGIPAAVGNAGQGVPNRGLCDPLATKVVIVSRDQCASMAPQR